MKYLFILFIATSLSNLYSQDIILKKNGKSIESKIDEIGIDKIKYHKYSNLSGPIFIMLKEDVSKITFENGEIEIFNVVSKLNIDEVKKVIIENINEYGFERTSYKKNYRVFFEGDYLWFQLFDLNWNKIGANFTTLNKALDEDFMYDLKTVYKFDGVSKRENELAFVNIYASRLIDKKNNKWSKDKLVIRVKGHENADKIMKALKEYNRLLNL